MIQTPAEMRDEVSRSDPEVKSALNVFGSELPDEYFTGVFRPAAQA